MNEEELLRKYRETGDIAIRNQIVEKYLYIASVLAKKFVGRGVEYDDLYQVASLALIKGVERFDERKGLKFSTFITPTITGEIKNYFRDRSRLVHLPRKVSELRVSIKREAEKFLAETGRNATAKELAARNITVNAVAPGFIETDMTASLTDEVRAEYAKAIPLKRMGTAQEVADAVAFLASDKAAYITGQVLAVNGGMYC